MQDPRQRALAFERILVPPSARPARPSVLEPRGLDVTVVFTSAPAAVAALKHAAALADRLSAHITMLVPQVVPYPVPLESPPVLLDFSEGRLREVASACPIETKIQIYLCRDRTETLKAVLEPRSLVVIGTRRTWWPTRETQLARTLRRTGHEVIVVGLE